MGSIGFRSGLFGYNKSDVNSFLKQLQEKNNAELEKSNRKIATLSGELEKIKKDSAELNDKITYLNGQLNHFRGKEEEIEKMSVGIGTMYLVAKQNAAEVISEAERCSALINEQSKKQLEAVETADKVLFGIKESVRSTAENLSDEIDRLSGELINVRRNVEAFSKSSENKNIIDGETDEQL